MVTPLTPDEIGSADFDDLGLIDIPDIPDPDAAPSVPPSPFLTGSREGTPPPPEAPPEPDEPPAHARKHRRRIIPETQPGEKTKLPPRVIAGIRRDITAKVSVPLEISGTIWAARDPLCGGVFLAQRPAVADALTDIIMESPDLIAFFTGPAGAFMRYLNLAGALWPVFEMIAAHHVYHSVETPVPGHREMPAPPARAA